jgi:hypothetical protein
MTDPSKPVSALPWYKRRTFIVTAAVIVGLVVTVVTDLPEHTSIAAQFTGDKSVMQQVDSDVGPCAYAANESFMIYAQEKAHILTNSDMARVPSLLRDDQSACSFTDDSIYELSSDIEVPGSSSGKPLGQMVGTVTLWATSDALAAIESIQVLVDTPSNASALAQLKNAERTLASDRATAEAELQAANKVLGQNLPGLNLPVLPDPGHN